MAGQTELNYTYSTIDKIFRKSLGEFGSFSGAMFNGDFTLTLEEAQERKHRFVCDQLGIARGAKVLDMGCGWGAFIKYATENYGADCTGLTLSEGQAASCRKHGLKVLVKDCRHVTPADLGTFDAVVSMGAFEHFCSMEDFLQHRQEEQYRNFFKTVFNLLPPGGKFFLQTMTFGPLKLHPDDADLNEPKGSDRYVLGLMKAQFPGSWLPAGPDMVTTCASPWFNLLNKSSGRVDYIETIRHWRRRFRQFDLSKYSLYGSMIAKNILKKDFRYRMEVFRTSPNKVCFERNLMDHYRFVFQKNS